MGRLSGSSWRLLFGNILFACKLQRTYDAQTDCCVQIGGYVHDDAQDTVQGETWSTRPGLVKRLELITVAVLSAVVVGSHQLVLDLRGVLAAIHRIVLDAALAQANKDHQVVLGQLVLLPQTCGNLSAFAPLSACCLFIAVSMVPVRSGGRWRQKEDRIVESGNGVFRDLGVLKDDSCASCG